jgi:hypothetical protein
LGKINFPDLVAHLVMDGLRSASKAEVIALARVQPEPGAPDERHLSRRTPPPSVRRSSAAAGLCPAAAERPNPVRTSCSLSLRCPILGGRAPQTPHVSLSLRTSVVGFRFGAISGSVVDLWGESRPSTFGRCWAPALLGFASWPILGASSGPSRSGVAGSQCWGVFLSVVDLGAGLEALGSVVAGVSALGCCVLTGFRLWRSSLGGCFWWSFRVGWWGGISLRA